MTSKYRGISYSKERNKWICQIMVNGKLYRIGRFEKEEEAVEAYNKFIEENKDILPEKSKNKTKRRELPKLKRNNENLIERNCQDCGKLLKFQTESKIKDIIKCTSCCQSIEITKQEMKQIIKEYENGASCEEIGLKHDMSGRTIGNKLIKNNCALRPIKDTAKLTNKKHGNIYKAHNKVRELCKIGEFQKQQSAQRQGIPIKEWKKFITPENKLFYKSPEYKELRRQVLMRDKFTCQLCSQRGGKLQLHHIKKKCEFPELKLEKSNCCALCMGCHNETKGKEHLYEQQFKDILINKHIT